MDKVVSLSQICIYNPQRQNSELTEKLFIVRKKQFGRLMDELSNEKSNEVLQHHLFIAQRGMGKTTILKRIEVELHKRKYKEHFIPLLFPEEQYNLRNLGEFWINCIAALADALEAEQYTNKEIERIESRVRELLLLNKTEDITEKAECFLIDYCFLLQRRAVLLIDNIELVFSRLSKQEQIVLRGKLSENNAPVVVAAGVAETEDITDAGAPFHDFFKIHYLKKLNFEEFIYLLKNLSILTQSDKEILPLIIKETPRLKALEQLTGGNPRAAVMLFKLIIKGFSPEINDDLEALLDEITPLYKTRFEELAQQQQIIIAAIAMNWDAINIRQLSQATRYENNQLSPQLKRLTEDGWLEATPAYKAKGNAYYISERFFNIWFLLRCSNHRRKKGIYFLSRFLEFFYGEDISITVQKSMTSKSTWAEHFLYEVSLVELAKDNTFVHRQLKEKLFKELWDFKKYNIGEQKQDDIFLGVVKKSTDEKIRLIRQEIESGNSANAYKLLTDLTKNNTMNIFPSKKLYDSDDDDFLTNQEKIIVDEGFEQTSSSGDEDISNWKLLALSVVNQKKYHNADNELRKAVSIDDGDVDKMSSLGLSLYCQEKYNEAESVFKRAVSLNENDNYSWFGLGISLFRQEKYSEAENVFAQAVLLNTKDAGSWYGLGQSLFNQDKYKESEETFKHAVLLDKNNTGAWNMLGNLYHDYLDKPDEAENAYHKAILSDRDNLAPKFNLMFLYRDKLGKMQKAEILENTIKTEINIAENGDYTDAFWLNKALFELYKRNGGVAKKHLMVALNSVKEKFPQKTQSIWQRFSLVTIGLDYGSWLLGVLEETGYDLIFSPYYVATQALDIERKSNSEKAEIYLKNKAIEVSEPARKIIKKMRRYKIIEN
jgi:tetratricopeptide (TPR) repeat protein